MKLELTLFAGFIVGCLFKIQHWPFASLIVLLSLSLLSITYFLGTKYLYVDELQGHAETPLVKIFGPILAVAVVGILFKVQHWPQASTYLLVGGLSSALAFGIALFQSQKANDGMQRFYGRMSIRTGVFTVLTAAFYFL